MTQKVSKIEIYFQKSQTKLICFFQICMKILLLMNHQPFFALLKVKVNLLSLS